MTDTPMPNNNPDPFVAAKMEEFEKQFSRKLAILGALPYQDLTDFVDDLTTSAIQEGERRRGERVKKWAEDNHMHHEFADVDVADLDGRINGCDENDSPYVNSMALVKFLEK